MQEVGLADLDYTPEAMTFSLALRSLKEGCRVARSGWNGKGMWLAYVGDWSGRVAGGNLPADWAGYLPFIAMFTADKRLVPWLCSQTDALAEDWIVVA